MNGNPYVGPRTFERVEADRFFGRDNEARNLLSMVIAKRLVLFYAQSGAGKSSLINTRLLPRLIREGFIVLPVGRVSGEIPGGINQVENIFSFNLILSLMQDEQNDPGRFAHMSLVSFLANLTTTDGEHYYYDDTGADVSNSSAYEEPAHVLIIDQFEEILTTHQERWSDRVEFFRQLDTAMAADPLLWVVLTLREDYVAALDPYTPLLFNRMRDRFYMQRLGYRAALQAVKRPAAQYRRPFAPGVAETLVDNLRQIRVPGQTDQYLDEFIQPVQLQVVCYQLWEKLNDRPLAEITLQDLDLLGNVDTALAEFYEQVIIRTLRETGVSEIELRNWFNQKLITEAETRGTVYQGIHETAGLPNEVVKVLADQFLLRAEIRAGAIWYELVHDRFVTPILEANRAWWLRQSPLIQAAQAWEDSGRAKSKLYLGQSLKDALIESNKSASEPLVAEFLAASQIEDQAINEKEALQRRQLEQTRALAEAQRQRAEEQTRAAKRFRRLALVLVIVLILATGAAILAVIQQRNAERAEQQAAREAQLANSRELAAASVANLELDPELSILLANHALAVTYTIQAENGLRQALQTSRVELRLSDNGVPLEGLAISPDGSLLAAGGHDHTVKIWDISDDDPKDTLRSLAGHEDEIVEVVFNSDGTRLATASIDRTAKVWNTTTGEMLLNLSGHEGWLLGLALSPDGERLATVSVDGTARVWDALTGELLQTLSGHEGVVIGVTFSPDGKYLITTGQDRTAKVWDSQTGQELHAFLGHTNDVYDAAFHPAGTRLATVSADGTVKIWDIGGDLPDEPLLTLFGHTNTVVDVAFSPNGRCIATAGGDKTAKLWDTTTGQILLTLSGHTDWVNSVVFIPGPETEPTETEPCGKRLATASHDGTIRLWNIGAGQELMTLTGHTDAINAIDYSPDGTYLATASYDGTAKIWEVASGQAMLNLAGHHDWLSDVVFSADGMRLATASFDGTAKIWDVSSGQLLQTMVGHSDIIWSVSFSPNGEYLATASEDMTAKVWDSDTGQELQSLGHDKAVIDASFNPVGTQLATAGEDGFIRLWDVDAGQELAALEHDEREVYRVAFSQDGLQLATAGANTIAKLWSVPTREELNVFSGHADRVFAVAFDLTGSRLATASADRTARVWDIDSGQVLSILPGHTREVNDVDFSPDGKFLATAGEDGTVRIYVSDIEALKTLARGRVTRFLTPAECQQYLHRDSCS